MQDSDKTYDPLQILPYELWVKCITLYARQQPEGALPLLAVSSEWQSRLLETPEIWTSIYLDGGHDEQSRVQCFFHLSKSFPIEIILDKVSGALEIAIKHRDRISLLTFKTRLLGGSYTSLDILETSQSLSRYRYPNLSRICINPPCEAAVLIPPSLIEACPALIGIYGAYIHQDAISLLPPSCTKIGIIGNGVLPTGIGDRLQVMKILCYPSGAQEIRNFEYFTEPTIHLNSFELRYGRDSNEDPFRPEGTSDPPYLSSLQKFAFTAHYVLKELSIDMPWYEVAQLAPYLSACTELRNLELILDHSRISPLSRGAPSLTINDIGHIRKLSLYSTLRRVKSAFSTGILPSVTEMFIRGDPLRNLEELRVELRDPSHIDVNLQGLLRTTKKLRRLHLIDSPLAGSNDDPSKVLLKYLHTLVVDNDNPFPFLDVPNLVCLVLTGTILDTRLPESLAESLEYVKIPAFIFYQWKDALSRANPSRQPFPRLMVLHLLSQEFDRDPSLSPDFSSLHSITLEDNFHRYSFGRRITGDSLINHFMLEMVLSPKICPRLHTIRATKYPNWALAATMFHRRNTLQTVTPIRSFWLHGYPQMAILHLISKALDESLRDDWTVIRTATSVDRTIRTRYETGYL